MPAQRPSKPARLDWERAGGLKRYLLLLYGDDLEFQNELTAFLGGLRGNASALVRSNRELMQIDEVRQRGGKSSIGAGSYLEALRLFAEQFGLHRLGAPERASDGGTRQSEGEQLIHLWCHQTLIEDSRPVSPAAFAFLAGWGGDAPIFSPPPSPDAPSRRSPDESDGENVDDRGRPIVLAVVKSFWDPRGESQLHVKKRLTDIAEKRIEQEIDRIANHAKAIGYQFDWSRTARRDISWLFLKARHRWSYQDIAVRWNRDEQALAAAKTLHLKIDDAQGDKYEDRQKIQKAVIRMAEKIDLSRSGW